MIINYYLVSKITTSIDSEYKTFGDKFSKWRNVLSLQLMTRKNRSTLMFVMEDMASRYEG
jgi:hypothetical protein